MILSLNLCCSDLNDSHCYYLLKIIIEGITGVKCQELFVLNSEVNPEHLSDKDMVFRCLSEN